MALPHISNQTAKIMSLTFFVVTSIIKILCVLLLNGHMNSHCIAGWHIDEEVFNHLILLIIGLLPDIVMIVCILIGMGFERSNIGADPTTIIYNFVVGLLTFCSFFPFLGMEDCKNDSFGKIKSVGIYAAIAGILQMCNGIACLLFLAPEERCENDAQPTSSNAKCCQCATSKRSASKAKNLKVRFS